MIGSWQDVAVIIGLAITLTGTYGYTRVQKRSEQNPDKPSSEMHGRIIALEEHSKQHKENHHRLELALEETKRRHETVVDGIYIAINDLKDFMITIIKENKEKK